MYFDNILGRVYFKRKKLGKFRYFLKIKLEKQNVEFANGEVLENYGISIMVALTVERMKHLLIIENSIIL